MTQSEQDNNTGPTRLRTITVQKSHHAVTSIIGNTSSRYLRVTELLARKFLEHGAYCQEAAREIEMILLDENNRGVNK